MTNPYESPQTISDYNPAYKIIDILILPLLTILIFLVIIGWITMAIGGAFTFLWPIALIVYLIANPYNGIHQYDLLALSIGGFLSNLIIIISFLKEKQNGKTTTN